MILTPADAHLVLILMGKSQESAIRPGEHTAEHTIELVQRLRECAEEKE